jgi:hypothetical protein
MRESGHGASLELKIFFTKYDRTGRFAVNFDFAGLIVLLGFVSVFIALLVIKAQQVAKPEDQDW